jgi:YD repeat-containing protein
MNVSGMTEVDKTGTVSRATSSSFPASGSDYLCGAAVDPKVCNQPIWTRDPKGNQTDFTYDSTSGGILTAMAPASIGGAVRPLKVYTYASYSATIRDATGTLVSGPAIWLPATETQCQTAAANPNTPVCDASATQQAVSYQYGVAGAQDQLLLKRKLVTADGTSRRTCYTYDWRGLPISQTSPRGTTSPMVCQ